MSKALSFLTGFIVVFVLTIGLFTTGRAASQPALMPAETVNIAHFFKPPPGMDASTAAKHFNTIVLTGGDHQYRDQLLAAGFASDIPQYFRADGIEDPGGCTATPHNNQVAYKAGDFCFISQNHPDWFLLDPYGRRIKVTSSGNIYRMDPANAGWRNFFLWRVLESRNQNGWSGLFLDNVEGGLSKFYGPRPVKYPDNASYQAAVAGFLQYLDVNYSQKYGLPIVANIVARPDDAVWFKYLSYLDGAMQERFAVAWDETAYLDVDDWEEDLEFMEKTQAGGKYAILIATGNRSDLKRQTFAFASYLLINQGKLAFRYSSDDEYRDAWLYDNYKVKLGSPLGTRYRQGSYWRRDFKNGYVIVDPAARSATINAISAPQTPSPVGVFRPSNGALYLKHPGSIGFADIAINYGLAGDYPVVGDWDGDGDDTIGVYRDGRFLLRNSNTVGFADINFLFGQPGDQPVAGDWDGDGVDTIGVYRPSTGQFLLRNSNSAGEPDRSFYLGNAGDVGLAGDWNGDGVDTTGVFRPSNGVIFLKNSNTSGFADVALNYGLAGDKPVVGDWDNDGDDTIGIYRRARFYLRNSNTNGFADIITDLGNPGDMPIAGDWDGR